MWIFVLGCIALLVLVITSIILKSKNPNQHATRRRKSERLSPSLLRSKAEPNFFDDIPKVSEEDADTALGLKTEVVSTKRSVSEERQIELELETKPELATELELEPAYIVLHVMAQKGEAFGGYQLLQTLLACGMRFGKDKIFHRYLNTDVGEKVFSLVSVTKPGTFDLAEMNHFSCPGLTLFLLMKKCQQPMLAFDAMYNTARRLADELGGEICAENREPLTAQGLQALRADVDRFIDKKNMLVEVG